LVLVSPFKKISRAAEVTNPTPTPTYPSISQSLPACNQENTWAWLNAF